MKSTTETKALSDVTTKIGIALFITFCVVAPFTDLADILLHL
ncbi:hypothetical protein [Shewanella sp. AS1]|nr:hypothetical protein [Shewanella sp. AS1]